MTQQMPSRGPSGPAVQYEVLDQVPNTRADAQGRPTRGVDVYYATAGGVRGVVFIPEARFTPDNVRSAIRDKVGVHDAVQNLSS